MSTNRFPNLETFKVLPLNEKITYDTLGGFEANWKTVGALLLTGGLLSNLFFCIAQKYFPKEGKHYLSSLGGGPSSKIDGRATQNNRKLIGRDKPWGVEFDFKGAIGMCSKDEHEASWHMNYRTRYLEFNVIDEYGQERRVRFNRVDEVI